MVLDAVLQETVSKSGEVESCVVRRSMRINKMAATANISLSNDEGDDDENRNSSDEIDNGADDDDDEDDNDGTSHHSRVIMDELKMQLELAKKQIETLTAAKDSLEVTLPLDLSKNIEKK